MTDLQKEAESESKYLADHEDKEMYKRGFIDCGNSKHVQAEKLKAQIEVLTEAFESRSMLHISGMIFNLNQQLNALTNES